MKPGEKEKRSKNFNRKEYFFQTWPELDDYKVSGTERRAGRKRDTYVQSKWQKTGAFMYHYSITIIYLIM